MKNAEHMAQIATCFRCPEYEAGLIFAATQYREYAHRSAVALRGDVSAHLFLVIDGLASADLFSAEGQYAQLAGYGPGELFGAYPEATTHRADITAQGGLSALMIETRIVADLARTHISIAQGVACLMARQLDMVLDRMAARIGLTATGRFYRALLARADSDGWVRPLPILSAMAIGVNTTRETASRALAILVRRGIAERHDDGLKIVSVRLLEDLIV